MFDMINNAWKWTYDWYSGDTATAAAHNTPGGGAERATAHKGPAWEKQGRQLQARRNFAQGGEKEGHFYAPPPATPAATLLPPRREQGVASSSCHMESTASGGVNEDDALT